MSDRERQPTASSFFASHSFVSHSFVSHPCAMRAMRIVWCATALACWLLSCASAVAQVDYGPSIRYGEQVPPEVEQVYQRGLQFLATSQQADGSWPGDQQGAGITGLCVMSFLAHGEDPNFGPYSQNIQRAVRNIIAQQSPTTGFLGKTMYHHGFGMLALAEAYGAIDEQLLWGGLSPPNDRRSLGEALELAVRCAITAQKKNGVGGWRYSPQASDADTSVAGAVLMGLLAARNAGIEVPDKTIDLGLAYFRARTQRSGGVDYSSSMGGFSDPMNRTAIATLVYAIGKQKGWKEYQATSKYIADRLDHRSSSHPAYFRYYMAQALFQSDVEAWKRWKVENNQLIQSMQRADGSMESNYGWPYGTAMSLLSLALEYRFLPIYER